MNEYDHKLDTSVYTLALNAKMYEVVSVIVFFNEDKKEEIFRKLVELGSYIKYELDILGAFAVDLYADKIQELIDHESISYIAQDAEASTYLDIARHVIGVRNEKFKGSGVGVAVVDTGCYPHLDLVNEQNRIVKFVDLVQGKKDPYDDNGHGTHCCGIIAGDGFSSNGMYRGIAPKSNLIVIKAMNKDGGGIISDILGGLDWIWKNKDEYNIRVVSMSLGANAKNHKPYDPLMLACEKLWDSGVVVVAAAGNDGPEEGTIGTPGISKKIITVGCLDDHRNLSKAVHSVAAFSSRGPSPYANNKPDLIAPGVDIMSLANVENGYIKMSGTSMSTPMVSGACALLLEKNPLLTPDEIKNKLMRNAYSLKLPVYEQGSGIINLKNLLK